MSVTSVRAFANTHGGVDEEGVRTYTNLYHVYTDDKNDGSVTARMGQAIALGLPAYGDYFVWANDVDVDAICKTRQADLTSVDDDKPYYRKWTVTIGYTTKLQKRDPSQEQGQPHLEPWKVSGSYAVGTRTVDRDKEGKINKNSVEEPVYDEIPSGNDTLILEGNTQYIDLAARKAAVLHTNSSPLWGLGEREWLLVQWAYDVAYKNLTPYVRHRMEFHAATDDGINKKWDHVYKDFGTRLLVDATQTDINKKYKPVSSRDVQLLGGVYLNGFGQPNNFAAAPKGFQIRDENIPEFDFASLGFLPDPLPGPFI